MRKFLHIGLILLMVLSIFSAVDQVTAQQSEQYKIEEGTVLQDTPGDTAGGSQMQSDMTRTGSLNKQGYSALVSEIPLRMTIKKTNMDFSDSTKEGTDTAETSVKIMYTGDGGYAFFMTAVPGPETAGVFKATGCTRVFATCFVSKAGAWTDGQVYGFGYNITGAGSLSDFLKEDYYRPFVVKTSANPTGVLIDQGEGNRQGQTFILRIKLKKSVQSQGTSSQSIILTGLHDW